MHSGTKIATQNSTPLPALSPYMYEVCVCMHPTPSQVTRTHMCARTHGHAHTRSHALIHVHLHGGAIAQLFLALLNHGTGLAFATLAQPLLVLLLDDLR